MCLILFAYRSHPRYPLVLAANRDEFLDRATLPAAFWNTEPKLLGGRDLRCGGTWLAVAPDGRFAAVVNYRDPCPPKSDAPSRGRLVTEFLLTRASADDYLETLKRRSGLYNGFTFLFGDVERLFCFSNRGKSQPRVEPGIHGVSNHLLDSPWPKVVRGKKILEQILSTAKDPPIEDLFAMLADRHIPDDYLLPDTGAGIETERLLSPLFISGPGYATRSSTVMLIDRDANVTFAERTCEGNPDRGTTAVFRFRIEKPRKPQSDE